MTGEWHWRVGPTGGGRGGGLKPLNAERFPTHGEAESWLGETYPDLLESGVLAVSLFEGDRRVYGPMSLEPGEH